MAGTAALPCSVSCLKDRFNSSAFCGVTPPAELIWVNPVNNCRAIGDEPTDWGGAVLAGRLGFSGGNLSERAVTRSVSARAAGAGPAGRFEAVSAVWVIELGTAFRPACRCLMAKATNTTPNSATQKIAAEIRERFRFWSAALMLLLFV